MNNQMHPICKKCWSIREPNIKPLVTTNTETEICCNRGMSTNDGIYIIEDPDKVKYYQTKLNFE